MASGTLRPRRQQRTLPRICFPSILSGSAFLLPEGGKDKSYLFYPSSEAHVAPDFHSSFSHIAKGVLSLFPFYR